MEMVLYGRKQNNQTYVLTTTFELPEGVGIVALARVLARMCESVLLLLLSFGINIMTQTHRRIFFFHAIHLPFTLISLYQIY